MDARRAFCGYRYSILLQGTHGTIQDVNLYPRPDVHPAVCAVHAFKLDWLSQT